MIIATIAHEVGLMDGSSWVLAEGSDAAVMTRSIPVEKMLSDALLAYGQNGEAIRPEQGYPRDLPQKCKRPGSFRSQPRERL